MSFGLNVAEANTVLALRKICMVLKRSARMEPEMQL